MFKKLGFIFNSYLNKGNARSVKARKNTIFLIFIRVFTLPISFLLVPLTLGFVNSDTYGIWITLSSIVAWMSFFDIGLGNGLRNKLAESLAHNNLLLARKYISTTFAILSLISIFIFFLFLGINKFMDWSSFLNVSKDFKEPLSKVTVIIVSYFCLRFVLSIIQTILLAKQEPSKVAFQTFIEQIITLSVVFVLTKFTSGSLVNLSLALCIPPVLVLFFFNFYYFAFSFKNISPSIKSVDFKLSKSLFGVGFKFFIIQIAGIIQFQTANYIIIRNFGAGDVTVYNIAFKYFNILMLIMTIFIAPLWSAVTDAYAKNDTRWIENAEKKYRKIALILIVTGLLMLIVANSVYNTWLGKNVVKIPFNVSLHLFIFNSLLIFGSVYCNILNGLNKLSIQFKASLFSPLLFIFLNFIFLKKFNLGLYSVIFAASISNFNGYLLAPIQYFNWIRKLKK
jgi:O-antigen/teichoic acid export membrane protein